MASKNFKSVKSFFRNINKNSSPAFSAPLRLCEVLFSVFFLLFFSCQSAPKTSSIFLEDSQFAPLNSGASAYIFANAQEARPILELLPLEELNDKHVKQMLDKTDFLVAGLFKPESGSRFQLVTWGKYPSNSGLAFSFNKNWKKQRSPNGGSYWYSKANGISLAMNTRQVYAAASASDNPSDPFAKENGVKIPDGFNAFRKAPLSFWIDNPGPIITRMLSEAGVPLRFPVQQLFLNLYFAQEAGKYEAEIRFQFDNAVQARGVATLLSLASGFAQNIDLASLFLANPPVQNGRNIDIKTAPLGEKELSLLLQLFPL